ncbi:MAG: ATP-binding protein [Candidatus Obscuribacter sp.]|nr:ATP-binding protein [Candidatus Obscuribacter sp.]
MQKPFETHLTLMDDEEIARVIQNFISNSLKHSQKNSRVTINIDYSADEAILTVTDQGRGISEEDKPRLFQRFWQTTSGGRYYASTGLGLYLCRLIVEVHNGRIWCESELGKGSTFGIAIPDREFD